MPKHINRRQDDWDAGQNQRGKGSVMKVMSAMIITDERLAKLK